MQLPLRQIYQEMVAEKLRLALTIIAVAWATLCIATMLSVGEGIRQGVLRIAHNGNGNLIYLNAGRAKIDTGTVHLGEQIKLSTKDADMLQVLPNVKLALPTAIWATPVKYHSQTTWHQPLAVTPAYQKATGLTLMPGGRWFDPLDERQQRKVIVLGYNAAAGLFSPPKKVDWFATKTLTVNPVGKIVKLNQDEFTVIGVLKKSSGHIEKGDDINYASFVPLATWQSYHKNDPITAINLLPISNANRATLAKTARQIIAREHGANVHDDQAVQIEDMLLKQKSMNQFLIGLQGFLGIIGFVTLAVAGVGIANVMYAMVKRSTRDIGVRMAVGATPSAIRWHYVIQSLLTMALGGAVGLMVTFTLVRLIGSINLSGNQMYESLGQPVPVLSISVLLIVISALLAVGVAAAWLPANRAASITPLQALQSE